MTDFTHPVPPVKGIMFKTEQSRNNLHYVNLICTTSAETLGSHSVGEKLKLYVVYYLYNELELLKVLTNLINHLWLAKL